MGFLSNHLSPSISLPIQMPIGHLDLMIDVALVATVYILVAIWSLGQLLNKKWFLALVPNPSIRAWPTQRLNSLGSNPYLKNSLFPCFNPPFFTMIISTLFIWLQILSFILKLNMWKLIIILFVNESYRKLLMFHLKTKLLIS